MQNNVELCMNCHGRCWVPNKYNRPMMCGTCAGCGAVKTCLSCDNKIPIIFLDKCSRCIIENMPDSGNGCDK